MDIKMLANCYVGGEPRKAGDVVRNAEKAQLLIGMGKAEKYVDSPKPAAEKPTAAKAESGAPEFDRKAAIAELKKRNIPFRANASNDTLKSLLEEGTNPESDSELETR